MELFLDSVNFDEIKQASQIGILTGLTTTPTFMHRQGISNIDEAIVELSSLVPQLQVEALGDDASQIVKEAERLSKLPTKCELVYKIPVSNEGIKACKQLTDQGKKVNIHLIYTLNQAYMAMLAGATYVCPLVGRLHDQGHDAMALITQATNLVNQYRFKTKIMVSSVRHAEHVRQSLLIGAQACTIPWSVMSKLVINSLTDIGTAQFVEHTNQLTVRVKDILPEVNPVVSKTSTVLDALVQMTAAQTGAVSIIDESGKLISIFTDGDVRRQLQEKGKSIFDLQMEQFVTHYPITIGPDALLGEVIKIFKAHRIDNIIVEQDFKPIGMLDIQDLVEKGLIT